MEDIIRENFCNLCKKHESKKHEWKKHECMKLYVKNNHNILTYGCSNYEQKDKSHPLKKFDYQIRSNQIKYDILEVKRYGWYLW